MMRLDVQPTYGFAFERRPKPLDVSSSKNALQVKPNSKIAHSGVVPSISTVACSPGAFGMTGSRIWVRPASARSIFSMKRARPGVWNFCTEPR